MIPAGSGRSLRSPLLGALAAFAFALALQGARPLWEPDEGRYVDVALEMLRSDDWWTPRLHHEVPHYSKPPLTYWAVAASVSAFGRNEWAARLPTALAFGATILLVGGIARRLAPGIATTASIVYATSLLPFVAANIVTTDTLVTLFGTLGVAGFVELRFGSGPAEPARWVLWGGFGLAFLTKGPPGVLALLAILLFHWRDRRSGTAGRRLVSPGSLLLFLVVAFGWFAHEMRLRPDLVGYLLGDEVFRRIDSPAFHRHAGWLGLVRAYGPVAVAGLLPWWPLAALRRRPPGPRMADAAARRFLRCWLLVPLAVFVVSQSRLPLYLLPLAAPGAIWVAARVAPLGRTRRSRLVIVGWAAFLLCLKGAVALVPSHRDGRRFAAELAAQLPGPPTEVAFVEARPRYSLSLYLECEVEEIDLATVQLRPREPSYRPAAEPLTEELADAEGLRVFLVPYRAHRAWVAELAAAGLASTSGGSIEGFMIHLDPERIR
ncbi:MAG TPA: glycosyltransferase family 39 protein [Thermoanaerobaculia bacterium]|nr:glycosyltransferase family 39 protein [Thermoanaerobaculia bacterium]